MLRVVLQTLGSRIVATAAGFVVLLLTTRTLGVEGVGVIGLVTASVGIIGLVAGFVGGSTLVYLIPRHDFSALLLPAYAWALIAVAGGTAVVAAFGAVPPGVLPAVAVVGGLTCVGTVNTTALIGKGRIPVNNAISVVQGLLNVALLSLVMVVLGQATVARYFEAVCVTGAIVVAVEFWLLRRYFSRPRGLRGVVIEAVRYGFVAQAGTVVQFLNYRLAFFLLNAAAGVAAVGVYALGVTLAESVWMAASSIALVQYARIANTDDREYSRVLTVRLAKVGLGGTGALVAGLLLVPPWVFAAVFGRGFAPVWSVVAAMAPGIVAFGGTMMIAHYFAGTGRYALPGLAAVAGLVVTLALAPALVPHWGAPGAALSASASYVVSAAVLAAAFVRTTGTPLRAFLPAREDAVFVRGILVAAVPSLFYLFCRRCSRE